METAFLLYDGHCRFCSNWAKYLRNKLVAEGLEVISAHDSKGAEIVESQNLQKLVPSTLIYVNGNQVITKTNAIFAALSYTSLKGWRILRFIPKSWRDKCYDFIASNRYLLGSTACNC